MRGTGGGRGLWGIDGGAVFGPVESCGVAWGLPQPGHGTRAGISPCHRRRVEMLRGRKAEEKTQRQASIQLTGKKGLLQDLLLSSSCDPALLRPSNPHISHPSCTSRCCWGPPGCPAPPWLLPLELTGVCCFPAGAGHGRELSTSRERSASPRSCRGAGAAPGAAHTRWGFS